MSGDGYTSLSSRALNAVRQFSDSAADRIVLEKDTYLIDENNKVMPIPAGTVAVLECDTGKTVAPANGDISGGVQAITPLVETMAESDLETTNMPADSTSMETASPTAAVALGPSNSTSSVACEVVEATSSDPSPGISLSDMYVQGEEEVTDERNDQETVVSASGPVDISAKSPSKDAGRKPVRKKKPAKSLDTGRADGDGHEVKRQKISAPPSTEVPLPVAKKPASQSSSSSSAVAAVSASGRPQRSTPRRSVYEMLHGGESKPQRRSTTDPEPEGSTDSGHAGKKLKVTKSDAAAADEPKCADNTKTAVETGTTTRSKGHRRAPSVPATFQTPVSTEGCDQSSNCHTSNAVSSASADEISSACLSPSSTQVTGDKDVVQSVSGGSENAAEQTKVDDAKDTSEQLGHAAENSSSKKPKQSKKAALLKPDNSQASGTAAAEKGSAKKKTKNTGKSDTDSKPAKTSDFDSKQPHVVDDGSKMDAGDDIGMPGMPYHYFTNDGTDCPAPDSDGDSCSSLLDDLASEDVEWMRRRIVELELQVRRLREGSVPAGDKPMSRCWQDVLAEFSDPPSVNVDEKMLLVHYEQKLRALDRELDERAAFLRIREGCIARRERQILEKERELNKKVRDLEHQRRLHGRAKLMSKSVSDSGALPASAVDSSTEPNRKQALEKEVRLELRKQELDRQKHVLDDTRKKLAARERELEDREQALVDADLLNMASGFASAGAAESRGAESGQPNGGATVEFSDDDDDDDFGGDTFRAFSATSVSLPLSLDRGRRDSDNEDQLGMSEVSCSL